jgi:hypothetical protein
MRSRYGWIEWGSVALAAMVIGFAIAQAFSERSWQPIWQVAWLPAVLVASLSRSRRSGACWPRSRRRSRS